MSCKRMCAILLKNTAATASLDSYRQCIPTDSCMHTIIACQPHSQAGARLLDDDNDLEQCSVVGAAVVFIAMGIQQAGIPRRNKDGCLIQAPAEQVQAPGSSSTPLATCTHLPHADFLRPADTGARFPAGFESSKWAKDLPDFLDQGLAHT